MANRAGFAIRHFFPRHASPIVIALVIPDTTNMDQVNSTKEGAHPANQRMVDDLKKTRQKSKALAHKEAANKAQLQPVAAQPIKDKVTLSPAAHKEAGKPQATEKSVQAPAYVEPASLQPVNKPEVHRLQALAAKEGAATEGGTGAVVVTPEQAASQKLQTMPNGELIQEAATVPGTAKPIIREKSAEQMRREFAKNRPMIAIAHRNGFYPEREVEVRQEVATKQAPPQNAIRSQPKPANIAIAKGTDGQKVEADRDSGDTLE